MATETAAPARGMSPARLTVNLRRTSFANLALLLVEAGLGMGVAVFVRSKHSTSNPFTGPAAITAHAVVGILLVLGALMLCVRAVQSKRTVIAVSSIVAAIALIGAWQEGSRFIGGGGQAAAMTMGVLTLVAILCYALNLFVLGSPEADASV